MPQSKKAKQLTRIIKDADKLIQGIGNNFLKLKDLITELRDVKEDKERDDDRPATRGT